MTQLTLHTLLNMPLYEINMTNVVDMQQPALLPQQLVQIQFYSHDDRDVTLKIMYSLAHFITQLSL